MLKRCDGYLEGNNYLVSWCIGYLVELYQHETYNEAYKKWLYKDLQIIPQKWKYQVYTSTRKQFDILKKLMEREDVESLICATDADVKSHLSDFGFHLWRRVLSMRDFKTFTPKLNTMLCMKQHFVETMTTGLLVSTVLDFFHAFMGKPSTLVKLLSC